MIENEDLEDILSDLRDLFDDAEQEVEEVKDEREDYRDEFISCLETEKDIFEEAVSLLESFMDYPHEHKVQDSNALVFMGWDWSNLSIQAENLIERMNELIKLAKADLEEEKTRDRDKKRGYSTLRGEE